MMTDTEQDQIVGEMVKERNALRRERTLLSQQLDKSGKGMRAATAAANLASQGDWQALERGFDYQDAPSYTQSLTRLREVTVRLAELERRLDAC